MRLRQRISTRAWGPAACLALCVTLLLLRDDKSPSDFGAHLVAEAFIAGRTGARLAPPPASGPAASRGIRRYAKEELVTPTIPPGTTIYVCTNSNCKTDGARACMKMLQDLAPEGVVVKETGCLGPCSSGPNVLATPQPPSGEAPGGRTVKATRDQPAGVCFTGMKSPEDAALLAPWGFEGADGGPLGAFRMMVRSSQLDQVPWPILLYVGFNVVRLIVNLLFGVDLLNELAAMAGKGR
eukprot:TRINITY_DN48005_c0_g1_i1.p1 TRINITY_DN48005_c0_g1~~TRINITY_DN48005_c0_g1_i1.p1  ORF type:complete len:239 (-),score=47.70 TRINITY_DN48005_c0_g1_i1:495-1211(-)